VIVLVVAVVVVEMFVLAMAAVVLPDYLLQTP